MLDEQDNHSADVHTAPPDVVNSTDAGRLMNMINYERSASHRLLNQIDSSVTTHLAESSSRGEGMRSLRGMSTDSEDGMTTPHSPYSPKYHR